MTDHQSACNRYLNETLTEFLCDFPEASVADIERALEDAKADLPDIWEAAQ